LQNVAEQTATKGVPAPSARPTGGLCSPSPEGAKRIPCVM
jgi:hypothetical protein